MDLPIASILALVAVQPINECTVAFKAPAVAASATPMPFASGAASAESHDAALRYPANDTAPLPGLARIMRDSAPGRLSVRTSTYDEYVKRHRPGAVSCEISPSRMVTEVRSTITRPLSTHGGTFTSGVVETLYDSQTGEGISWGYSGTLAPGSHGGPGRRPGRIMNLPLLSSTPEPAAPSPTVP